MTNVKAQIGRRIRESRKAFGYSQEKLAGLVSVRPLAIGNWENGITDPPTTKIVLLCQVLEISPDYLLGFTGAIHPKLEKQHVNGIDMHRYLQALRRHIEKQDKLIADMRGSLTRVD